jgi:hypothetical protein
MNVAAKGVQAALPRNSPPDVTVEMEVKDLLNRIADRRPGISAKRPHLKPHNKPEFPPHSWGRVRVGAN